MSIRDSDSLPFLVTRWLSHFAERNLDTNERHTSDSHDPPVDRIQDAIKTLADAFAEIGAFGTTLSVSRCLFLMYSNCTLR